MNPTLSTLLIAAMLLGGVCLAAAFIVLAYLRKHDPRSPTSCAKCSYDLRGLPVDSPCPECAWTDRTPPGRPPIPRGVTWAIIDTAAVMLLVPILVIFGAAQWDVEGAIFAGGFMAPPYGVGVLGLLLVRSLLTRMSAIGVTVAACVPIVLAYTLALLDAFVWHPDAQGGLVIIAFPVIGTAAVGYGLLGVVMWLLVRVRS